MGAGISGLCAAYEIVARSRREGLSVEVLVLEASSRVGGKVFTEVRDGAVFERGPDSFLSVKPRILELARELGLGSELVPTNPARKGVCVVSRGEMIPLPEGGLLPRKFSSWLGLELLSLRGKLRAGLEPFVPAGEENLDESLADFTRRRLGSEVLDKIVAPLFAGIYAGDAEKLSLASAFPQFKEMEKKGGVLRSLRRMPAPSGRGNTMFMTLKGGLSSLTQALALRLPGRTVRTGARVERLSREGRQWKAFAGAGSFTADVVVSALPANALASLLQDLDGELAAILGEISFVSTATVSFLYEKKGFPHPLDGFGFLAPKSEGLTVSAATFTSTKFQGRAPEGKVLVRCFLGGAGREESAELADAEVERLAREDLVRLLGLGSVRPVLSQTTRWLKANPQYTVGHELRLQRIASCLKGHLGLILCGCSYKGVGLPDCAASGRAAGEAAVRLLSGRALDSSMV